MKQSQPRMKNICPPGSPQEFARKNHFPGKR
jgi:hypothetical protein